HEGEIGFALEPPSQRVMRSHRFAPEENSKESQNDTDNVCDGGRNTADDGCFGDLASCADCATEHRGYRRPKQCNAGILVSSPLVPSPLASAPLVSSRVVSPSPPLLARPLRARALPLVVIGRPPNQASNLPRRSLRRGLSFHRVSAPAI